MSVYLRDSRNPIRDRIRVVERMRVRVRVRVRRRVSPFLSGRRRTIPLLVLRCIMFYLVHNVRPILTRGDLTRSLYIFVLYTRDLLHYVLRIYIFLIVLLFVFSSYVLNASVEY